MTASMNNLPTIDAGQPIRTAADDMVKAAKDVSDHAADIKRDWSRLAPIYHAPEQHLVLSAMDPPANRADDLLTDVRAASRALHTYADQCDALRRTRATLISDIHTFENTEYDQDDPRADTQDVHQRHGFDLRAQALERDLNAAQSACRSALDAINSPPPVAPRLSPPSSAVSSGQGPSLVFLPRPPAEPLPEQPFTITREQVEEYQRNYWKREGSFWDNTKAPFVSVWNQSTTAASGARDWWHGTMMGFAAVGTSPMNNRGALKESNRLRSDGAKQFLKNAPLVASNFVSRSGSGAAAAATTRKGFLGEHVNANVVRATVIGKEAHQARRDARDYIPRIVNGHSFEKHVITRPEYPHVRTRQQFQDLVADVVKYGEVSRALPNGRRAFWKDGTVVIVHPGVPDGGTVFRPKDGYDYFIRLGQ